MVIGDRLRKLREEKKLSQGEIEVRTGLLRCYTSRVENGHTIPSLETLEKYARALETPLYQVMYDGDEPPLPPSFAKNGKKSWDASGPGARLMKKLRPLLAQMSQYDRDLVLFLAGRMSRKRKKNGASRNGAE